jgi:hypothetical protein
MGVAGSKEKLLHRDEAEEATGFAAEQGEHGSESVAAHAMARAQRRKSVTLRVSTRIA